MRSVTSLLFFGLLVFLLAPSAVWAQDDPTLLAYWAFNDGGTNPSAWPPPIDADEGDGSITHTFVVAGSSGHSSFAGTTINAQPDYASGGSFVPQGDFNNGNHFTASFSTEGFEDVVLSYATQRTNTGFTTQTITYSVDGGATFEPVAVVTEIANSFELKEIDLPSGANDQSEVLVRFTLTGATATGGNNRFDNFMLFGGSIDGDPGDPTPVLSFTGTFSAFETAVGTPSAVQSVALAGTNLTDGVTVTAPIGFEVALTEGGPFSASHSTMPTDGSLSETVFARLTGDSEGSFSGDLTATSVGAQSASRTLSGTVGPEEPVEPGEPVVIVEWNFNNETLVSTRGIPANLSREVSIVGASFNGYVAGRGGAPARAANSNGWNIEGDRYWLASFSTEGFENLLLSSYQQGSDTGPRDFVVEYRLSESGAWTDVPGGAITVANNFTSGAVVDLALPADAADQPLVQVRWRNTSNVAINDGSVGATGTNRIDDIRITGVAIDSAPFAHTLSAGEGWYLLAPPTGSVTPAQLAEISLVQGIPGFFESFDGNFFTGYTGDPADNSGTNSNGFTRPTSSTAALESGRGFAWYHWSSPVETGGPSQGAGLPITLSASGSAPDGVVTVTFTEEDRGNTDNGFFLLGNPFGDAFCVGNLSASNPDAVLSSSVLIHTPDTGYVLRDETETVDPWTGFFAQVEDHDFGDGPLTFTMTDGACDAFGPHGPIQFPFDIGPVKDDDDGDDDDGRPNRSGLDPSAMVLLHHDASTGWDRYDLGALQPFGSRYVTVAPVGAGVSGGTVRKAVESLPMPQDEPVEVVLSLQASHAGVYRLRFGVMTLPVGWNVELRDLVTGQTIDPRESDMVFESAPTADSRRFVLRVEPPSVSAEEPGEAVAFGMEGIYPNPASSRATVTFTLPEASEAAVQVFDVLGRAVTTLTEARLDAGRHTVLLDAAALSSGVYVVRLTAGGQVATQRLTIVR